MGLKGNLQSIRSVKKRLLLATVTIAHDVAKNSAPILTNNTRAAFKSGKTVYGAPRPPSVSGQPLTLRKTGLTEASLAFVATGTILRARLGAKYARYLIGKYDVLPNGPLPESWRRDLSQVVSEVKLKL